MSVFQMCKIGTLGSERRDGFLSLNQLVEMELRVKPRFLPGQHSLQNGELTWFFSPWLRLAMHICVDSN